jgi:hypothetical protein
MSWSYWQLYQPDDKYSVMCLDSSNRLLGDNENLLLLYELAKIGLTSTPRAGIACA